MSSSDNPADEPPTAAAAPLCHYCGLRPAGSREHLPGVAALNDAPVTVNYLRVPGSGDQIEAVERVERDGFVVRTICRHCNCRTGGNYGGAFKKFALQFTASGQLDAGHRRTWVSLRDIEPLRVLKQLAGMFLAAQPEPLGDRWQPLRDFVLRRDMRLPPGIVHIFLYRNTSGVGRIAPLTGMGFLRANPRLPTLLFAEISWPPLGVVFATSEHPLLKDMRNVTEWGQRSFKAVESFGFSVPQYHVEANFPLGFGVPGDVDRWMEANHVVLLLRALPGQEGPLQISSLVRKR